MSLPLPPKEAGKFIANEARHVTINDEGIKRLGDEIIKRFIEGKLSIENFSQSSVHPKASDPKAVDWLFVVDSLNFCFWHNEDEEGWVVDKYTGYFALCAAINRAIKEGIDITNPAFYSTITKEQLQHILRSDTKVEVPLINERLECLHSVGKTLIEKFEGSFKKCVEEADNSATKLLNLIVNNFQCFKDEAVYRGQKVSIYKRAQILIGDIWACFQGNGLGKFDDLHEITMFADYRIPQSLLYFQVFKYSKELTNLLTNNIHLENGCEMEVEIRGCSIHAVTLLMDYINVTVELEEVVNAILIDHFLWDFRRQHAKEICEKKIPFHKTICIYY